MKLLAVFVLLNSTLVMASVKSVHQRFKTTCTYKQVSLFKNDELAIPQSRISRSEFEETAILNHEKTKETVIWKLNKRSINGQEVEVKDSNGVSIYTYKKESDKERSVHYLDSTEYLDQEEKPQTEIFELDYHFKVLSEVEGKKTEAMSYLYQGKAVKALRLKTTTDSTKFMIETFFLNPDSLSNEYSDILFAHRLCEYEMI